MTPRIADPVVPNHHANYPAFTGVRGLVAAATMSVGRRGIWDLAVHLTAVGPDDDVVDVGCGPGAAVRRAARHGAAVTGVDPAPVMLRVAWRATGRRRDITYAVGGAEALPLADGSATVVWSISSVHHWSDLDAGLAEAYRVLAMGGRFLTIERRTRPGATGHASHGWTDAQAGSFADRCRDTGFLDVQVTPHTAGRRRLIAVTASRP